MKALVTTIALVGLATTSYGFNLQKSATQMVQKERIANATKKTIAQSTTPECAQLNGTWDGECTRENGKVEKTKLKITQGTCVHMTIQYHSDGSDSDKMSFDMTGMGISNLGLPSVFASLNISYAGRWSVDKNTALIEYAGVVNSPLLNGIKTILGSRQYVRQGDQLLEFGKSTGFEDDGEVSCKYNLVK